MKRKKSYSLYRGDCLKGMKRIPDNTFTAVITDPPYGLKILGKNWDHGVPGKRYWKEALRITKPGGVIFAFGGTRMYHRLACAIEDAGWEIKDCLSWLYGSGFPKGTNISKAIDRKAGAKRKKIGTAIGGIANPDKVKTRSVGGVSVEYDVTVPATELAKEWDGYGTTLKPCWEVIICATKPHGDDLYIIEGIIKTLEARICLSLSDAVLAEILSAYDLSVSQLLDIARWNVDDRTSSQVASFGQTDMSSCDVATSTVLNIVSSWRSTLGVLLKHRNTCIIETASSQTIDLKTLKSCLLKITPESMLAAEIREPGSALRASHAVSYSTAALANIASTLTLSALGHATSKEHIKHQGGLDVELSPNWEPIIMAMKPLDGGYVENLKKHGVAGINIDRCRVGDGPSPSAEMRKGKPPKSDKRMFGKVGADAWSEHRHGEMLGRWPPNLALDEDAAAEVDKQAGLIINPTAKLGWGGKPGFSNNGWGPGLNNEVEVDRPMVRLYDEVGGASRFFYTAKATRSDLPTNDHPTMKPTSLMRWLVRLVTMPKGTYILDPFMGSGSTGVACLEEEVRFYGMERDKHYMEIAKKRLRKQTNRPTIFR